MSDSSLISELREIAEFAHKVTGCSVKRHPSKRAADRIEQLKDWIREAGIRTDTCTFSILGEICKECDCKRK